MTGRGRKADIRQAATPNEMPKILDFLATGLQQRSVAYETINNRFAFMEKLPDLTTS